MADEITLQFVVAGPPSYIMEEWRTNPPPALANNGHKLVDESYNSLTFERKYLDWPQKLMLFTIIGLLLIPFLKSVFRVTVRFDEQATNTKVTIAGTVHPRTRAALHQLAAEHGGPVASAAPSPASTLLPGSPSS